mmetsp:Transcript_24875/g.38466  ORF Transcript_24875/g.38466 Transcript_24875/m.38466 type:complete len:123 (-) Transcript_24875:260-628(-)
MAQFFAGGLLLRLLGFDSDGSVGGLVKKVLELYTSHIVPNMHPDERHMHVTTLADITNAAGKQLVPGVRALRQPGYPSIYHFHLQPFIITREHHRIWNLCLDAITTSKIPWALGHHHYQHIA